MIYVNVNEKGNVKVFEFEFEVLGGIIWIRPVLGAEKDLESRTKWVGPFGGGESIWAHNVGPS